MLYQAGMMRRVVRPVALGAFIFYLLWNVAWIAGGQIPPSILKSVFGLPCPTTGGYRSLLAFCGGDFAQSFLFNPMMPAYILLFGYSIAVLLRQILRRQRLVLRPLLAWMWCLSLVIGWAAKFALGKQYW
jgi:hypothetical protein